jgi:hypothetical protein
VRLVVAGLPVIGDGTYGPPQSQHGDSLFGIRTEKPTALAPDRRDHQQKPDQGVKGASHIVLRVGKR